METTVFLVLDINLKVMEDTMVFGTYNTLEDAMKASLKDVISKNGKEIKSHGFPLDGIEYTTTITKWFDTRALVSDVVNSLRIS